MPHEGEFSTGRAQNATTCKDWKDVLLCQVVFENAVYKPSYSATTGLMLWFSTPAEVTSLYGEEGHMRSHPMECQHTSHTPHTYCSGTLRPLP